jgi:UDP-N-acetylmuramoylalanine--D-glutamate ligase
MIEDALSTFEGLPHRSQIVAEIGGVTFVNDSKATNVDSALQALRAFDRVRWIVGGQMKDGGLDALAGAMEHVTKAYVIGRQAEATALDLPGCTHEICGTMETAVARAASEAVDGEVVLLAPAGASFDQYDNFEDRGEDFIREVARLR